MRVRPIPHAASTAELAAAFRDVIERTDQAARRAADPVHLVHEVHGELDQELVALVASSLAFGNAKTIIAKVRDVLARLGGRPTEAADDPARLRRSLRGWVHRVYRGGDVASLLIGARAVQRQHGSLGNRFAATFAATNDLRAALADLVGAIRAGGFRGPTSRGAAHILPDPDGTSACKRLLLFLRWMVRPDDGVDLGLWADRVPASALLIPVDTHVHKLSRNLGLTSRRGVSYRAAEEITARLAMIDPTDPVRFDFPLCHLGMVRRCPSKRDPARCDGCGVKPVCLHWRKPEPRRA